MSPTDPSARALLLAAGRGTRLSGSRPKQFELVNGRPLFSYALARLTLVPGVEEIVLVLPESGAPREISPVLEDVARVRPGLRLRTVLGGPRRQDSVAAGLRALGPFAGVVLVHDAARPFPPVEGIRALARQAARVGGALLAVPVVDTVKRERSGGLVAETLDRRGLWLAQTPQAFRAEYGERLAALLSGPDEFTDEAAALESLGVDVALVPGDSANFKVTLPEDLRRAAAILDQGGGSQ